jgi:hypothetical protein
MHWSAGIGIGLGIAISVATACSSSSTSPLAGQEPPATGTDGGDPCPTGTAASDGATYVTARGCPKCHNADMAGSQTALTSADIGRTIPINVFLYPPNLTPDLATGIGKWTDTQVKTAIVLGIDDNEEKLCPQMEHYSGMCDNEATGIVAYLRSIPAVSKVIPGSICPPLKTPPLDSGQ